MRILYGVSAEGMGHAVRSKVIITHLQKKHEVLVVAGDRAYNFLKTFCKTVHVQHLHIAYDKNKVRYRRTILENIAKTGGMFTSLLKVRKLLRTWKPDVIITDFEPLTAHAAWFAGIPCLSIDNQHIVNAAVTPRSILEEVVVRSFVPKADYHFAASFFFPPLLRNHTTLVGPIQRREILDAGVTQEDHIVVYQTSQSDDRLLKVLAELPEKFIVYGLRRYEEMGNVILKDFDEKAFIDDLSSCKAIIANGGFTVIAEALHLRKPVLSIPVERQIEQVRNATYIRKMGYGMNGKKISVSLVKTFLRHLPQFNDALQSYSCRDNQFLFKKLEQQLTSLTNRQ